VLATVACRGTARSGHPGAAGTLNQRTQLPSRRLPLARIGPVAATIGPVIKVEFERVEALELLGMTLAHLNDAEAKAEVSPRLPLLMAIRDKLAFALREE